jgi:hypothetical protein
MASHVVIHVHVFLEGVEMMHGEAYIGGLPCVTNEHVYYFVEFFYASNGSLMLLV